MLLDYFPKPFLKFVIWLYQQKWYHWVASILLGFWDVVFGAIYRLQDGLQGNSLWKDWQNRPCPSYPIPMTDNDVPVKPERSDAAGTFIATMIVTYVEAAELTALLPEHVELDPSYVCDNVLNQMRVDPINSSVPTLNHPDKVHAIIYMCGYTENLRRVWNPLPGLSYMEFAVGIPNVKIKRPGGYDFPFFYLPTLWLSRFYPVWMGWMVGYLKHWGWVYGEDTTYHIAKLGGKKILSASFEMGSLPPLTMGDPNAAPWRELLDQPQANPFGQDQFLYLHYHWDWSAALLQPVSADVEVFDKLPGLSPGKYHFAPINLGHWVNGMPPAGAFRLCAPFELLSPFDRESLADWRMMMPLVPAYGAVPPTPAQPADAPKADSLR